MRSKKTRYIARTAHTPVVLARGGTHLQAEEVSDGADVVREHELSKANDPGLVSSVVEVELPQELPDLEGVLERCPKKQTNKQTKQKRISTGIQRTHNTILFSMAITTGTQSKRRQ